MVKEIRTLTWCDLCQDEDVQEEAVYPDLSIALGIGSKLGKPRTLDLCEMHHKTVYEPLESMLDAFGAPVGGGSRYAARDSGPSGQSSPIECKFPGCGKALANQASFSGHVRQMHGLTIGEYREQYGAPADDRKFIGEPVAKCDQPGCDVVYSHEKGNPRPGQALAIHLSKDHGIKAADRKQ